MNNEVRYQRLAVRIERLKEMFAANKDEVVIRNEAGGLLWQLLSLAVNDRAGETEGVQLLEEWGARYILKIFHETSVSCHHKFLEHPKLGPSPDGGMSDDGLSSDIIHLAWLIGEFESTLVLLDIAVDKVVQSYGGGGKFWKEYMRALHCLANWQPFHPCALKLHGYERYWTTYLDLIGDLTNGRVLDKSIQNCHDAFVRINQDARMIDWTSIDGDGKSPVKWNMRLLSTLHAADHFRKGNY